LNFFVYVCFSVCDNICTDNVAFAYVGLLSVFYLAISDISIIEMRFLLTACSRN